MVPALAALRALQALDTAADHARRRIAELPAAQAALAQRLGEAAAAVEAAKSRLSDNQTARRALEKDVGAVDTRSARFSDHRAQVKTNQEYTALLHEIETAKADKDALEERILLLMETGDQLAADLKAAEAALALAKRQGDAARQDLEKEAANVGEELLRLEGARKGETSALPAATLARYEQLVKGRRGIAVAAMAGETCTACHVRLRPHVAQQIRRNDEIVQCESCQRILYFDPPGLAD